MDTDKVVTNTQSNNGMHPTRINGAFINMEARGRVMPSVRRQTQGCNLAMTIDTNPILKTVGFQSPEGFNAKTYDEINEMLAKFVQTHALQWRSFASGWTGLAHRYRAAIESYKIVETSLNLSSAPPPEERYLQELALFTFVVSGVSSVECFYYSMYCIGGIIAPHKFPMLKDKDLKFYSKDVASLYTKEFPCESLSTGMTALLDNIQLKQLIDLRNVLTHRGILPRLHFANTVRDVPSAVPSNPTVLSQNWDFSLSLKLEIFREYLETISQNLETLMNMASDFVGRNT